MIKPFKVNVSDSILKEINNKIKNYPWHEMPKDGGWQYGTNLNYMKEISDYWVNKFSWKKHEEEINKFSNFTTDVDGLNIHFIMEKGSGSKATPLLLMHGWPGSVVEFLHIIQKLAHPEKFGGKEEDAFDVIVPSLPGFGFSGSPSRPMGPRKMSELLNKLMINNLGYKNYLAQGGDWGATICNWLAYDHFKTCKAIHINCLTMRLPDELRTQEEKDWQNKFDKDKIMQDGYRTQQATKPQTLSYSMMDSPVGIAAWIIEKMYSWSDLKDKNLESKKQIKKKEESLIAQKNILEASEFNNKLRLFRKDVGDFNKLSQESNRDLQNLLMKNKGNFLKLIEPILLEYVATNNITYLLQKKYIIVGHNDLNKTKDIIELVDKKINISNFNDSVSK